MLITSFLKVQLCYKNKNKQTKNKTTTGPLPIPDMTLQFCLLDSISSFTAHRKDNAIWFYLWGLFSKNFQEGWLFLLRYANPAEDTVTGRSALCQLFCQPHVDFAVLLKADNSRLLASLFVSFQMAFSFLDIDTVWAFTKEGKSSLEKVSFSAVGKHHDTVESDEPYWSCFLKVEIIRRWNAPGLHGHVNRQIISHYLRFILLLFLWIMAGELEEPFNLWSNASAWSVSMAAQSE